MKRISIWFQTLLLVVILSSCRSEDKKVPPVSSQHSPTQTPDPTGQQNQAPLTSSATPQDEWFYASDLFIEGDRLTVNGYDILKLTRRLPEAAGGYEISYAVIRRNARIIATFDNNPITPAHAIEVASFPLLGKQRKQIMISQTEPRGGTHWIIDVLSGCRVIFESEKYEVGREDIGFRDLDNDGIYELSMPVVSFYMLFDELSMMHTPLPLVIFRYNPGRGKYEPANHLFQSHLLNGVENRRVSLSDERRGDYLAARLETLLDYLYAGKEREGWSYFRQQYRPPAGVYLPGREDVETRVRNVLRRSPAYQLIRRNAAAAGR